eukprot:scaffold451_cov202-Skeletonema_dohrnii-CCMP3373.AAC.2
MTVEVLDEESEDGKLSAQRMVYASEQMILAGKELKGEKKEKPKGEEVGVFEDLLFGAFDDLLLEDE